MERITSLLAEEVAAKWYEENEIPDTEEMEANAKELYALYWDDARFSEIKVELESLIVQGEILHERQGFLTGFQYAVALLSKEARV